MPQRRPACGWRASRPLRDAQLRAALLGVLLLAGLSLGAGAAEASLGELSFLGCVGQVSLSECAAVPGGLTGAVEEPKGLAVSPDGANVYAADDDANTIDVFARNSITGELSLTSCVGQHAGCAATSPAKAVERPFDVAVSPDGRNVYAVSVGSNTVEEFSRNTSTGALTYLGCIGQVTLSECTHTSPSDAIDGPATIAISADGTSVYVASENNNGAVDEFQRNTSTGALKFEGCYGAGGCVVPAIPEALRLAFAVAISPDGTDVYVGGQGASISTFTRNASTGALTFKGCVGNSNECVQPSPLAINEPTSLSISPDGANLYAGNFADGTVDVFSRNAATGALTFTGCDGALTGDPGACTERLSGNPAGPLTVAVSPDGADVYVAAEQGVYEYARGAGGALAFAACTGNLSGCTSVVPEEALAFSVSLALSPNGASLYAGAELAKDLDVFGRETVAVCSNLSAEVPYDTATALTLSCSDADGKPVGYAITANPAHGTLSAVGAAGQVTYTPAAGYGGPDSFTFTAHNADGTSAPATAQLTVGSPAKTFVAGTSSSGSGGSPATGYATTPQAIEELLLGCGKRPLVLSDVLISGRRVELEGSAAKSLDGRKVKIIFDGGRQVATAKVGANGEFTATAPLPAARLLDSNSARYMAESGSQRSLNLKLTRRLSLEPPRFSHGTVTLVGQVVPPLTKPISPVIVQQQLECGRVTIAKRFTPPAGGRFHITLGVPAGARAGVYRLSSIVTEKPGARHGFQTYSLLLAVVFG